MKNYILFIFLVSSQLLVSQVNNDAIFDISTDIQSRSITFENPTGEPGEGGKAASEIGVGRKGAPAKMIKPGETVVLCDIKESGTIRHIWMTGDFLRFEWLDNNTNRNQLLRSIVVRAYWDGQEHPSIECPLGDFMGLAHAKVTAYQSAVHSVGERAALNMWLPMPFAKGARITLTNESDLVHGLFYQIDYTIGDKHSDDVGRLHTLFRRENPTTIKEDFVVLPKRTGKGRFIGAVFGIRTLHPGWWGEGEMKFYMDGDNEYPTICGTGSEDYVGLSYGVQKSTYLYNGCNLNFEVAENTKQVDLQTGDIVDAKQQFISMYRWHIKDPIYYKEDCRVTIQQIGCCLYERDDDWSVATFWYEAIPSAPLPKMPSVELRTAGLEKLFVNDKE